MKKWYNHTFKDLGSVTSAEDKDFENDYKRYLKNIIQEID